MELCMLIGDVTGAVLILSSKAGQSLRALCSWIRYLRDQVYHRRVHHQWVSQPLDAGDQESDVGQ